MARVLPPLDAREIAAVFVGGALGTLARAELTQGFPHSPTSWPWPTFTVNIAAALLLGYLITRLQERLPPSLTAAHCSGQDCAAGSPRSRRCRSSCCG